MSMSLEAARRFIDSVPWRWVQDPQAEPHEYIARAWREVDAREFDAFCDLIRERGYRGRYRLPYGSGATLFNDYVEIDGAFFWQGPPGLLNRSTTRQHEPLPEQTALPIDEGGPE